MGIGHVIAMFLVATIAAEGLGQGEYGAHQFANKRSRQFFMRFLACLAQGSQDTVVAVGTAPKTRDQIRNYVKVFVFAFVNDEVSGGYVALSNCVAI